MKEVDIAIICPREVEFRAVQKILSFVKRVSNASNQLVYESGIINGKFEDWKVAVVEPEPDTSVPITTRATRILQTLCPRYIFIVGMAAGLKDGKFGDLVIGVKAYNYESGKEKADGLSSRPMVIDNNSIHLLRNAQQLIRNLEIEGLPNPKTKYILGPIASGSKVIVSTESPVYQHIKTKYEDTQAIEMEAHGFASTATVFNTPYLNIRGISDCIDNKVKADAEGFQKRASLLAAYFTFKLIYQLRFESNEIYKALKYCKIIYTRKKYDTFEKRNFKSGRLFFEDNYVKLQRSQNELILKKILSVERIKMNGEFAKSWVKVLFESDYKPYYFALNTFFKGWPMTFGGNQHLLKLFEQLQTRQTILNEITNGLELSFDTSM